MQQQATRYLKSALLLGFAAGFALLGPVGWQEAPAQGQAVGQGVGQGLAPEKGAPEAPSRPKSLLPEALQNAPARPVAPPQPLLPERLAPQNVPAAPAAGEGAGVSLGAVDAGSPAAEELRPLPARHVEAMGVVGPVVVPGDAGLLTPATRGVPENSFAMSDGRFLAALARRIDAPLASRWAQILVARALVSQTLPPMNVAADDWLAARAAALVAMGSAADAHRMLEGVNPNDLTGADGVFYNTLFEAALGAADPMALCPLVPAAEERDGTPRWLMVEALCQSGADEDFEAATLFDELRDNKDVADVDIGLAEKLAAGFGNSRRDAQIEWKEVARLDSWRLGMAVLAGEEIPAGLLDALPPRMVGWLVRMPAAPLATRARLAPAAAAMGAISSSEARRLLAAAGESDEEGESPGALLRVMGNAGDQSDRWKAYATLLKQKGGRYGYQLAAATAAAGIVPTAAAGHMAPAIVESLAGAGLAREALRWWPVAAQLGEDDRALLWAQLAPLSPEIAGDAAMRKVWQRRAAGGGHRAALLLAGLAGLAGEEPVKGQEVLANPWTQALTAARRGRRTGEALLIVAAGLHGSWADVPPDYVRRMVRALSVLGFEQEARLLVAEAATRG